MRTVLFPAAALALLTFCTPGNNRQTGETGMARAARAGRAAVIPWPLVLDAPTRLRPPRSPEHAASPTTPAGILSQLSMANTMEIQLSKLAAKEGLIPLR